MDMGKGWSFNMHKELNWHVGKTKWLLELKLAHDIGENKIDGCIERIKCQLKNNGSAELKIGERETLFSRCHAD